MKRLVLDTNTVISALFWQGSPRTVYDLVRAGKYQLLSSREIESELIRVLSYPKFGLTSLEILPIINSYKQHAVTVPIISDIDAIRKDRTDNIFLACAVDGRGNFIISGDHHLLELQSFQGIPIVTAQRFLQLGGTTD